MVWEWSGQPQQASQSQQDAGDVDISQVRVSSPKQDVSRVKTALTPGVACAAAAQRSAPVEMQCCRVNSNNAALPQ